MILIEQTDPKRVEILEAENEGGDRQMLMQGIFIQAETRNANGRVYPLREISSAVKKLQEEIVKGFTPLGEADHPENLNVNLERVSHMITEIKMQGNDGIGKLKMLDTPMGNLIKGLSKSGAKLGVSSRGSGNVDANGYVSDYEIVTVDVVAKPSAPNAYPSVIYESAAQLWKLLESRGANRREDMVACAIQGDPKAQQILYKEYVNWMDEVWSKIGR